MRPSDHPPDLHALATQLRSAIAELPANTPATQHLQALADQLDAGVDATLDSSSLQAVVVDFEARHPQAAEALQRVITALSSMGL